MRFLAMTYKTVAKNILALYTKADTFADSVDPHNELSYQDLHCSPFCSWFTTVNHLAAMDMSKCWDLKILF